jgi:uncharacterized protein (TIGR02300 family)
MPKEEWGVKRVCPSCSIRFYDLKNDPMTCPSCAHEFSLESLTGTKSRTMTADKPDAQNKDNAPKDDAEDEVVLDDDEDDDADAVLGDDVLDDDDDDTVSLEELADVPAEESDD